MIDKQVDITRRLQIHRAIRGDPRADNIDIFVGTHDQRIFCANDSSIANFGTRQRQRLAALSPCGIPLASLSFIDNAAIQTFNHDPLAADGRADIADIANGAELQIAVGVEQPLVKVADTRFTINVEPFTTL
ncbi:hypothetical protein D3C75_126520 [compost metagenome]